MAENTQEELAPYFEWALFIGGIILFSLILVVAFSFQNRTLEGRNLEVTWFREQDRALDQLLSRLRFLEEPRFKGNSRDGYALLFSVAAQTTSAIRRKNGTHFQLCREGRVITLKKFTGEDQEPAVEKLFENVLDFNCIVENGVLQLALTLVYPEGHKGITLTRRLSLKRPL